VVNGPEGVLYVVDMQEATDRGRIYRVVPEHVQRPKPPQLGKAKTYDLVALLASVNGWQADTAARAAVRAPRPGRFRLLSNMLNRSVLPLARLRALHALDGQARSRKPPS